MDKLSGIFNKGCELEKLSFVVVEHRFQEIELFRLRKYSCKINFQTSRGFLTSVSDFSLFTTTGISGMVQMP